MIEADRAKFAELAANYADNPDVVCIQSEIDDEENRLDRVLERAGVTDRLDFLSVDIDGLDYFVLASLEMRPLCISVEANAGHRPDTDELVPRELAAANVGQPLGAFVRLGRERGYRLIAYTGNAFLLHEDAGAQEELPAVDPEDAYRDWLGRLSDEEREWLRLANLGLEQWPHRFKNPYLSRKALGIPAARAGRQLVSAVRRRIARGL
jgi:hypothetical protein